MSHFSSVVSVTTVMLLEPEIFIRWNCLEWGFKKYGFTVTFGDMNFLQIFFGIGQLAQDIMGAHISL